MADVLFVAVICAFFALCVIYIRWCDLIIGPDEFAAPIPDGSGAVGGDDPTRTLPIASGVAV